MNTTTDRAVEAAGCHEIVERAGLMMRAATRTGETPPDLYGERRNGVPMVVCGAYTCRWTDSEVGRGWAISDGVEVIIVTDSPAMAAGYLAAMALGTAGAVEPSKPLPPPKPGSAPVTPWLLARLRSKWDAPSRLMFEPFTDAARLVEDRAAEGMAKYGTPLEAHNGRPSLEDARQETGDLMQYIWQTRMEGNSPEPLRPLLEVALWLLDCPMGPQP